MGTSAEGLVSPLNTMGVLSILPYDLGPQLGL